MGVQGSSEGERDWILAARNGDLNAFERLVAAYTRPIYNLCYRMLGDPHEAEDATQEVFLRIYRRLHAYDPAHWPASWILSIAAHYCIDRIRARRPVLPLEDVHPEPQTPEEARPDALVERQEQEACLREALGQLKPEERAVLILYYWHERSCEEIASILGLQPGTVRVRLHRARLRLAELLKPHLLVGALNGRDRSASGGGHDL